MDCFEYFLRDDRRVIIYSLDGRVLVKIVGEDRGRNLGDFIKEEREKLENEDLNYFTKMFRAFANCDALSVAKAAEDKPIQVEKPFELFSPEVNNIQLDNFNLIKQQFEKLVKNTAGSRDSPSRIPLNLSHGEKFSCEVCKKSFNERSKLKNHINSHRYIKPKKYQCDKCPKTFAQISKFHLHKAAHIRNRTISCNQCEMRFEKNSKLLHHKNSAHEEREVFKCNVCEQEFISAGYFEEHRASHYLISNLL